MALSTSITLTVSDYDIKMSRSLKFYKNDALKLIFTINYWGIDNAHGIPQKVLMPLEALSAVLFMETPDGTDSVEAGSVEGNVVTFYLNSEYTQNVGVSRMQIRLFDDDGCAITLPEFPFEIKENIYGGTDVNFKNVVLMDNGGNAIITEDFNQIDVGDVFLYGVEPIESVLYKEINDLELVENLDGTEDLIIQLNDGSTKRTKASEFLSAEVDLTGYATETYVTNKIAEASLSGGEVDLSGLATKDELNAKADKVHTHTASQVSGLSKVATSGNYNDLTNKPTVTNGKNGATFTPSVDSNGNLSWTNNGGLTNPTTVNIKGAKGDKGDTGATGAAGAKGDKGDTGAKGADGLTTAVNVNGTNYTHVNGTITLPNYPTVPTKTSQLNNDSGFLTSVVIHSIVIVDELPDVEADGVLYLVKGTSVTPEPGEPQPVINNLYPNQETSSTSDGFMIKFEGRTVTINGQNDSLSVTASSKQFAMTLEANKTYYLQFTGVSGSFDDSNRVSQSDGMICAVALVGYTSSSSSVNLIDWVERDASGIYNKYIFTPKAEYTSYKLTLQPKKLTSFSNFTCSIVIAEEGV